MKATIKLTFFVLLQAAGVLGCSASGTSMNTNAWGSEFSPPETLDTDRVHLEPLAPKHAEMDHAAAMSSRQHLLRTLHWGTWPREDMTVEQNRQDLARHWKEFENREGYAYTVLRPDGQKCLGCVYMSPVEEEPGAMELAYWVIEEELASGLDEHVFVSVMDWVEAKWPFRKVVMAFHPQNRRGIELAEDLGLDRQDAGETEDENVTFVLHRN